MTNKQVQKRRMRIFVAFLLLATVAVSGRGFSSAYADTVTSYTSVLTDLQSDETFNAEDYPDKFDDYSIHFIQIAESADGELFVYTYQPCQKTMYLVATQINMSLSETADGTKLYDLILLGTNGVFCKYKVKDFTVQNSVVRYYNITSIYRKWLKGVDAPLDSDNKITAVVFPVGWLWTAVTANGTVSYSATGTEVIRVYSEYLFMIRFSDGFKWGGIKSCDAHFISFNTNKPIDHIIDADLEFSTRAYEKVAGKSAKYQNPVLHTVTLTDEDIFTFKGAVVDRISRATDLLDNDTIELDETTRENLSSRTWVFNFYETGYQSDFGGSSFLWLFVPFYGQYKFVEDAVTTRGTIVTDAVILRLKYSYDGQIYNLGVVSNKQTGSNTPHGGENDRSFWEWLADVCGTSSSKAKTVFIVVVIIVILAILLPILAVVFPVVRQGLVTICKGMAIGFLWLLKGLWWLVCLPVKGIAALVRKIKERKGGGE